MINEELLPTDFQKAKILKKKEEEHLLGAESYV